MLVGMLSFSAFIQDAKAQEEDKFSMDVTLNSDIFFGFYPFFAGSYSIMIILHLHFMASFGQVVTTALD